MTNNHEVNIDSVIIKGEEYIKKSDANRIQDVNHPYKIGANYFIRTATHYQTGKLEAVYPLELVLSKASWVADSGRHAASLMTCDFKEVEMFPCKVDVLVNRYAIIDVCEIEKLPTTTK